MTQFHPVMGLLCVLEEISVVAASVVHLPLSYVEPRERDFASVNGFLRDCGRLWLRTTLISRRFSVPALLAVCAGHAGGSRRPSAVRVCSSAIMEPLVNNAAGGAKGVGAAPSKLTFPAWCLSSPPSCPLLRPPVTKHLHLSSIDPACQCLHNHRRVWRGWSCVLNIHALLLLKYSGQPVSAGRSS